jgi:diketogulonate reductase-like aldo/keto reductase
MYGRAEGATGDLLAELGVAEQAFLATKVWTTGREAGVQQMRRSGALLRARIDLMQVHNLLDWRTHLPTLRRMKEEGTIRYLGVTHYTTGSLADLAAVVETEQLDFVQLPYSIETREAERRLLRCAPSAASRRSSTARSRRARSSARRAAGNFPRSPPNSTAPPGRSSSSSSSSRTRR